MAIASVEALIPVNKKADYILNVVFDRYASGQKLTLADVCLDIDYELQAKGRICNREEVEMVLDFLVYARKLKKSTKRIPNILPGNGRLDYYRMPAYIKI